MMAEGTEYEATKRVINADTPASKAVTLADRVLLRQIKNYYSWQEFAKTVELLGSQAPTGAQMIANANVQAAYAVAWVASNPAIVPVGGPIPPGVHEEVGFI